MENSPLCDLSIIIINYNTEGFLNRCLITVASQSNVNSEVIVVDNASQDNSLDIVKNNFPWVNLKANKRNLGFARANNQALKTCKGKYVYFLNPDTEVREGAFGKIVEFMDSYPDVGLAGTRILNPDGSLQSSTEQRYPGEKYEKRGLKDLKGNIAWVLGASMVGRRDIVDRLAGFDERFYIYGEEQDLCLRVRKEGWAIGCIPDAVIVHWGGKSERDNPPIEVWKKKFEAELLFYKKHYSKKAIRAIKRANIIQAFWRIFTLKLTIPFCIDKEISLNKLDKYKLALEMFYDRGI